MVGEAPPKEPEPVQDIQLLPVHALTTGMVRGDEPSYRAFYDQYFPRLFGYLLVLTNGNTEHAEEFLQQTLIKVAAKVKVFEEEQQFWGWLAKIAKNVAFDNHRQRKRYLSFLERFSTWRSESAVASKHEGEFDFAMAEAIATLDSESMDLLKLRYEEGLPVKEIAALLSSTEKAVESRLARLRAELKRRTLETLKHGKT
jgi:RNA polymerase sigma-70 factor (ECF subfamily)